MYILHQPRLWIQERFEWNQTRKHAAIIGVHNQQWCSNAYPWEQVVKVIWHKAASPPYTDGSITFTQWCQCAPHLVHPNWHPHHTGSAPCWVALCISTTRHVLGQTIFVLKIAPSLMEIWTPILYMVPCAHESPHPKQHFNRFSHFCRAHNHDW